MKNNYEITEEKNDILTIRHEACGQTFKTTKGTYMSLKNASTGRRKGNLCPHCYTSSESRLIAELGTEYEIMSVDKIPDKSLNCRQIEIRHLSNKCQYYTRTISPDRLLRHKSVWCPICKAYDDKKDFASRVKVLCGDEYTVLDPYRGSRQKVRIRHNICGTVWNVRPDNFIGREGETGSRCPHCSKIPENHLEKRVKMTPIRAIRMEGVPI